MRKLFAIPIAGGFAALPALAHCPLCTIGAAAAAIGASYLGVKGAVIGVFIGAFAASMGWWIAGLIERRWKSFVPGQKWLLVALSYATTVFPLLVKLGSSKAFMIDIAGGYGSLLNRTYLYDPFLVGSLIGLAAVCVAPWLSTLLTAARKGRMLPFQGIAITFILLFISGTVLQLVM